MSDTPASAASQSSHQPPPSVTGNAGIAMLATALYLVTRLLLPPLILSHLSLLEYGLWSACFVVIMYVGLADVGISSVYVRFTAQYHAKGDVQAINRLLSTGIFTLSLLALLLLVLLWLAQPWLLNMLKVPTSLQQTASLLMLGTTSMYLLDLTLGAYCYLLHGLQRIREEKLIAILGYLLEIILIWLFLGLGWGIYSLLAAFVLRYCWSLFSFIRLAHRFVPDLSVSPRLIDRQMLRLFLQFGGKVQASALLATLFFSLDRILVGGLLGPKGIALFELGTKLPVSAVSIPSAISNVTLPAAARLQTEQREEAIAELYLQASRAVCLLAGLPLGFMALFAVPLCQLWLGNRPELALVPVILTMTALWCHLHITTGPGTAVFRAMGQLNNEFVYHGLRLCALSLALGISVWMLGSNLQALLLGLTLGNGCAALLYQGYNQRRFQLSWGSLFRHVWLPGLTAYPLAALLAGAWHGLLPAAPTEWQLLTSLPLVGLLYCLLWGGTIWLQLQPQEKCRLQQLVAPWIDKWSHKTVARSSS